MNPFAAEMFLPVGLLSLCVGVLVLANVQRLIRLQHDARREWEQLGVFIGWDSVQSFWVDVGIHSLGAFFLIGGGLAVIAAITGYQTSLDGVVMLLLIIGSFTVRRLLSNTA